MLQVLAAVGGACFLAICIIGGARLLLLARRTGQLPERVLGMGLFLMGGIGTPAVSLLFTQRVFRPRERWAQIAAFLLPAAALVSVVGMMFEVDGVAKAVGRSASGSFGMGYLGQQISAAIILTWTAFEALSHSVALRRRLRLGLADAVIVDRIQLWGGAMAVAALMSAIWSVAYVQGLDPMASSMGMAVMAALGVAAAAGIYLAFLPPKLYVSWVRKRAT